MISQRFYSDYKIFRDSFATRFSTVWLSLGRTRRSRKKTPDSENLVSQRPRQRAARARDNPPLVAQRPSQPKCSKGHNGLLRIQTHETNVLRFLQDPSILFTHNLDLSRPTDDED